VLSIVAVATTHGGEPGWIPDNLNEGHLDYFFWMMAALSLLNLALFVGYSYSTRSMTYVVSRRSAKVDACDE
jgi:peptide/histidine transporter 3/4